MPPDRFSIYGEAPYRVVEACIALGIHYLDLADGSDFVNNVVQFDAQARARAVFVLTGASSFPVLTAAVVRKLSQGMTRLEAVTGGIAPSPYAGVGLNVIRAIASYAGKPVRGRGHGVRRHAALHHCAAGPAAAAIRSGSRWWTCRTSRRYARCGRS